MSTLNPKKGLYWGFKFENTHADEIITIEMALGFGIMWNSGNQQVVGHGFSTHFSHGYPMISIIFTAQNQRLTAYFLLPRKLKCPLKINGWFRRISYWTSPFLKGHVSFQGCKISQHRCIALFAWEPWGEVPAPGTEDPIAVWSSSTSAAVEKFWWNVLVSKKAKARCHIYNIYKDKGIN